MTALETGRPYLSIGEVLNVLQEEFEEITVSKIRFLESEGLIHPERTSSGYRKFSGGDIERLRYILRLQRDQFLPLKVIKERLDEIDAAAEKGEGQSAFSFEVAAQVAEDPEPAEAEAPIVVPTAGRDRMDDLLAGSPTGISLTLEELSKASSLEVKQLRELESVGVIRAKDTGDDGVARYDEFALEAAKISRELIELGLEPRHLRMFRSSVDRWAALAEQMVLPLIKQRNPESRKAARETVRELVRVGDRLMRAMLRDAMSPYV